MVHNVKPKLMGRRVIEISDRSTAVCSIKMSWSIRDDFETVQSSHTNIPGISGQKTYLIIIL